VTGIDQSRACIEAARAHAQTAGLVIQYEVGMAESLPCESDRFDVVTCVDVLEHVKHPADAIAEISRVLKPGGLFCFDTLNRTWQSRWLMIWLLENTLRLIPQGIHDWQKFIPPALLEQWLGQHNLSMVKLNGFDLLGRNPLAHIAVLYHYWKTSNFQIRFDDNTDVFYIGVARKTAVTLES
jgi:2-polyprenyl-6-hydroxyphenyl methylase/3-demethylubiquinone-9 3-methyltransferase